MRYLACSAFLLAALAATLSCGKGSGTGGQGGKGGGSLCDPGENIFCRCPGGEPGTKSCRADGQGFEACVTKDGPCPVISTSTGSGGHGGATTGTTSTSTGGTGGAATGTLVVVAATADTVATWTSGGAWQTGSVGVHVATSALAPLASGGAALVARRLGGAPGEEDDLTFATWTQGAGLGAPQPVGAKALGTPALAPHGSGAMLVFLGTDNKHASAMLLPGSVGAVTPLPAATAGTQAFGPSAAAVAKAGEAVFSAYVGDDAKVYTLDKPDPAGAWGLSAQVAVSALALKTRTPALLADDAREIFYVRQSDGRICLNRIEGATTTGVEVLHDLAITADSPAVARAPNGDLVVAWHGFDNPGIYFLRGRPGAWGAPVTVDLPAADTTPPLVVSGLAGADAEILYLRGGTLAHARIQGAKVASAEEVSSVSGATSLSAAVVP